MIVVVEWVKRRCLHYNAKIISTHYAKGPRSAAVGMAMAASVLTAGDIDPEAFCSLGIL